MTKKGDYETDYRLGWRVWGAEGDDYPVCGHRCRNGGAEGFFNPDFVIDGDSGEERAMTIPFADFDAGPGEQGEAEILRKVSLFRQNLVYLQGEVEKEDGSPSFCFEEGMGNVLK